MSFCDMDCEWDDQFSAICNASYSGDPVDDRENCRPEDPMLRNLMFCSEQLVGAHAFDGAHKRKSNSPTSPLKSECALSYSIFPGVAPSAPSNFTKKIRLVPVTPKYTVTCELIPRNLAAF